MCLWGLKCSFLFLTGLLCILFIHGVEELRRICIKCIYSHAPILLYVTIDHCARKLVLTVSGTFGRLLFRAQSIHPTSDLLFSIRQTPDTSHSRSPLNIVSFIYNSYYSSEQFDSGHDMTDDLCADADVRMLRLEPRSRQRRVNRMLSYRRLLIN